MAMLLHPRNEALPLLATVLAVAAVPVSYAAAPLRYNRDIRPLLSDNCFHCHGPDANRRKSGLRLDIREEALKPAKSGATAVVPGKPEISELVARINHPDPDELMPPAEAHKVLSSKQKEMLRQWIAEGAAYEAHWAYTPVARPPVPQITYPKAQIANPIDAFIQQPLLERGIAPSPAADRPTLIRRMSLDLTGLPPSPAEVATFVRDADIDYPLSITRLTDRLLASPHHGERMAQHWLDVARYADTVGFHGDQNQNAWAYRDWVIDAFNANKPFDVFTTEQLAGDLLPNPTESQWTATCFNRLTMMTREGGAQPKEYLAKHTADRVRTVGMAWLGATVGCCECHDHKFDPWRQKDFYSLGAFFADVKQWGVYNDYPYTPNPDLKGWSNDHPFPPERTVKSAALVQRIAALEANLQKLLTETATRPAPDEKQNRDFKTWAEGAGKFLAGHPDGWESPVPVVSTGAAKPRAKGKAKAKPEPVVTAPADDPVISADGRILFPKRPASAATITVPLTGWLCAVKLELLPDAQHGGSILRAGATATMKPVFTLRSANGKSRALPMRFADAAFKAPHYRNGAEVIGVHEAWTTRADKVSEPHTSVWLPQSPESFRQGESLNVSLPENAAGCIRVSISPLVWLNPASPSLPADLRDHLNKADAKAARWFIRSTTDDPALRQLESDIRECRDGFTPVMVTERTDKPLTIRVLARGNWQDESGALCKPASPVFLPALPEAAQRDLTRLDLARWITSRQNPLTARVIMNRLWKQFFGTGLSAQVDDLGAQGEAPSHPELLDWLAAEFMESGWDIRHMVRLIVLSHTYQQQAGPRAETREADPQNRWLASQNPRRLEAEAVRDNALAIAGLLDLTMGGPPVKPYQPEGYYAGLQFPDRTYMPDTGSDQWRRGIYTHWQRTFLHPMMANFDAPSREDCVALRTASNTPQQALTLLNDPSFVEAARVWAVAVMASAPDDAARIDAAFRKALTRTPSAKERDGLLAFLTKMRTSYRERPDDAAKLLNTGFAPKVAATADKVELAAWASVCRVILNLHETITRY